MIPYFVMTVGPETLLKDIKSSLPQHVKSALIPGNTAFHTSYTEPIMASLSHRLASLNQDQPRVWSVPFVSTVTGQVETNVRKRINYHWAIECRSSFVG